MDENDEYDWVIQLLFGRYRPWGVGFEHLIITASVFGVLMWSYLILLRKRVLKYGKEIREIPRKSLPLTARHNSQMYATNIGDLVEVYDVLNTIKPARSPSETEPHERELGDPGWRDQDLHYNTTIASSYHYLESWAVLRRPGLLHRHHRTIRHYVNTLRQTFPTIPEALCQEYVNMYERAVFSPHKFTAKGTNIYV